VTTILEAQPEALPFDPKTTALIVVDMQNAYLSKGGYIDLIGFDVSSAPEVIARAKDTIEAARGAGVTVIYLQNGFSPDQREAPGPDVPVWHKSNALRFMRDNEAYAGKLITHGTWDYAIVDALTPEPGDLVVPKSRYSGFAGTDLDQILRARRIKTVLLIGVATNVCVESTLRDAYHREYFPVLIKDATLQAGPPAIQEATEFNVLRFMGWLSTSAEFRRAALSNGPS
jgi:ureidoacrylate peracid hydrolase